MKSGTLDGNKKVVRKNVFIRVREGDIGLYKMYGFQE